VFAFIWCRLAQRWCWFALGLSFWLSGWISRIVSNFLIARFAGSCCVVATLASDTSLVKVLAVPCWSPWSWHVFLVSAELQHLLGFEARLWSFACMDFQQQDWWLHTFVHPSSLCCVLVQVDYGRCAGVPLLKMLLQALRHVWSKCQHDHRAWFWIECSAYNN